MVALENVKALKRLFYYNRFQMQPCKKSMFLSCQLLVLCPNWISGWKFGSAKVFYETENGNHEAAFVWVGSILLVRSIFVLCVACFTYFLIQKRFTKTKQWLISYYYYYYECIIFTFYECWVSVVFKCTEYFWPELLVSDTFFVSGFSAQYVFWIFTARFAMWAVCK